MSEERKIGHSALRWNKDKQILETFDPNPPTCELTESDKKILTEKLLDECWHTYSSEGANEPDVRICTKCRRYSFESNIPSTYRTFTTPDDFFAIFDKLVERGEWNEFITRKIGEWESKNNYVDHEIPEFTAWLYSKNNKGEWVLADLAVEWLKEKD